MRRRSGFTLVELLVALALIIFNMAIISQAFVAASKSFRDLKAAGDIARRQRSVVSLLRRDLSLPHFEGRRRLSDPEFWVLGPPREGFFRVYQGGLPVYEGSDDPGAPLPPPSPPPPPPPLPTTPGVLSYRNTVSSLHFTVRALGNERQDFFSSTVPAGSILPGLFPPPEARYQDSGNTTFRSQWAEVTWFVRPALDDAGIQLTANGTPLYSLYRRQYGVVPANEGLTGNVADSPPYPEMSATDPDPANPGPLYFNTPISLTMPARRMGMAPANYAGTLATGRYPILRDDPAAQALWTSDLVLNDVISFDVQVLVPIPGQPLQFRHLSDPLLLAAFTKSNSVYPMTAPPFVFDTWSQARDNVYDYTAWTPVGSPPTPTVATIPLWNTAGDTGPIIRAIKISVRSWDPKTELTRQVTLVQAL
jgi:type II secretory pathway pseudopilin PulG